MKYLTHVLYLINFATLGYLAYLSNFYNFFIIFLITSLVAFIIWNSFKFTISIKLANFINSAGIFSYTIITQLDPLFILIIILILLFYLEISSFIASHQILFSNFSKISPDYKSMIIKLIGKKILNEILIMISAFIISLVSILLLIPVQLINALFSTFLFLILLLTILYFILSRYIR